MTLFAPKFLFFLKFWFFSFHQLLEDTVTFGRCKHIELGDHKGEIAVITGANRGIGAMITKELLKTGVYVIMGCRNIEDGQQFIDGLLKEGITGHFKILKLDLSSLESVKEFAGEVLKETTTINYLINNAGVILNQFKETVDNFEFQWQVNYLSHCLLCHMLLPALKDTPGLAKIINTSSLEHKAVVRLDLETINKREYYLGQFVYSRSKLAQLMFTLYLNEKLRSIGSKVEVLAAHPGVVNTGAFDGTTLKKYLPFVPRLFFKTPEQGAKPIVYAVFHGKGGEYIGNCAPESTSKLSKNKDEQEKLFKYTMQILNINSFGNLL